MNTRNSIDEPFTEFEVKTSGYFVDGEVPEFSQVSYSGLIIPVKKDVRGIVLPAQDGGFRNYFVQNIDDLFDYFEQPAILDVSDVYRLRDRLMRSRLPPRVVIGFNDKVRTQRCSDSIHSSDQVEMEYRSLDTVWKHLKDYARKNDINEVLQ